MKAFVYLVFPNSTLSVLPEESLKVRGEPMEHGLITSSTHGVMSGKIRIYVLTFLMLFMITCRSTFYCWDCCIIKVVPVWNCWFCIPQNQQSMLSTMLLLCTVGVSLSQSTLLFCLVMEFWFLVRACGSCNKFVDAERLSAVCWFILLLVDSYLSAFFMMHLCTRDAYGAIPSPCCS